jgi:hypothetical protein
VPAWFYGDAAVWQFVTTLPREGEFRKKKLSRKATRAAIGLILDAEEAGRDDLYFKVPDKTIKKIFIYCCLIDDLELLVVF